MNLLIGLLLASHSPAVIDGLDISTTPLAVHASAGHLYINDSLISVTPQDVARKPCRLGTNLHVDVQRIVVDAGGHVRCDCYSPLTVPRPTEIALASVTTTAPNVPSVVRPITDATPFAETQAEFANNAAALARTGRKLRDGGNLSIVFWGDSITGGTGASNVNNAFPQLTIKSLRESFPKVTFDYQVKSIAATNTSARLPNAESDVFASNPDLVIVEFVNDYNLKDDTVRSNYNQIMALAHKHGSEVLFVRPSSPQPSLYKVNHYDDFDSFALARELKRRNAEKSIGLANVEAAFAATPQEGVDRSQFMSDPLHPNDWGHALYARTLANVIRATVAPREVSAR